VPDGRTSRWFAAVGAALGGVVALVWWGAGEAFPPLVAGVLVVAADLVLTGGLHLDGLADTADGLLAHEGIDRERRLAIMRAPDVGAFGVAAVVTVLLLRVAVFASLDVDGLLVVVLWLASRWTMAAALWTVPYVGGGLGAAFVGDRRSPVNPLLIAPCLPLGLVLADHAVVAGAVTAGLVAAGLVVAGARRRLGGVTGDVLGAAGIVLETVGLVVASARW
jgi:adenosylcobinamide-GDP ribazoletransferase